MENTLEKLEIYRLAIQISNLAWDIYSSLSKNFQFHIGNQFPDSSDSIGANIAEGYGRYHYKESINFNNYARGSAFESRFWLSILIKRGLINQENYNELHQLLDQLIIKINGYNKYLRSKM
ncbi:MAG: four helix bundle protein [Bacteroidales bacterium]|nr:four helix bundle protein [Bacteroidales bacterium]